MPWCRERRFRRRENSPRRFRISNRRSITEKEGSATAPKLAKALECLANAHRQAGNLEKAGPFYKRALEIWQNARGPGHPKVGKILNSLGNLYRKQGRYGEAEKTLKRSLEVLENKLGKDHPQYAKTLDQLGSLYRELGRFEEA